MVKAKTLYICSVCGADSPKWTGKCPACGEWNTYVEEVIAREPTARYLPPGGMTGDGDTRPVLLQDIAPEEETRIDLNDAELNRVLGGGLVKGSLVLIGGEPGIGKSTLVLQTVLKLKNLKTLYVSGEESGQQLKLRADRLHLPLTPSEGGGKTAAGGSPPPSEGAGGRLYIFCETRLQQIFTHARNMQPGLIIIDSIQTIYSEALESSPGSISQVRECSAAILKYAKTSGTPVLLIGHINKEGSIAGPKVLEHIVDTVLQFEGDRHYMYRILRSIKNRFGSTAELGIYEMRQDGLREVSNPSELLLTHNHEGLSGVAIAAAIEGIRPFLIETQALVSSAVYGTPQRSATGFDLRRMNMLLAVLEKRAGFKLAQKDVFLNIAGGLKVNDPATDLAVISAILSSSLDVGIERHVCMAGEVGLSGEIRPVNRIEQRISEAEKLGFTHILIPSGNLKGFDAGRSAIQIQQVKKVEEAFRRLFG
jgi:DNA repair protein RadA/Sms